MTSQSSAHPEGYYWVSDSGAAPEIAELREGDWWLIGCEEPVTGLSLAVLSERLVGPAPVAAGPAFGGVRSLRQRG